jgi:predicted O-methyltransferase YrrM
VVLCQSVNLRRYTDSYTFNFVRFMLGLRGPSTAVTAAERQYLAELARRRRCIIEVGVFEGATSQVLCQEMDPQGRLYLVDPFFPMVRIERLLDLSLTRAVAQKAVRPWQSRVEFVRQPSHVAAGLLRLQAKADLIFIDAVHEYDAVLQDFTCWAPMLAQDGVIAFHDSHPTPSRPELVHGQGVPRLLDEIGEGKHGAWDVIGDVESVTAIRRRGAMRT